MLSSVGKPGPPLIDKFWAWIGKKGYPFLPTVLECYPFGTKSFLIAPRADVGKPGIIKAGWIDEEEFHKRIRTNLLKVLVMMFNLGRLGLGNAL